MRQTTAEWNEMMGLVKLQTLPAGTRVKLRDTTTFEVVCHKRGRVTLVKILCCGKVCGLDTLHSAAMVCPVKE
jgi:hypothetical protein